MQEFSIRSARAIGIVVLALAFVPAAPRGAAAQDAAAFISHLGEQGLQVLGPSVPPAQRAARFRQLLDNDFDLPEIGRFVLGAAGRTMQPAAQQEFLPLFRDYLVQAYTARLGQYGGLPFHVTGTRPNGGETVVTSQVVRGGNPIQIDWHVADHGGRLLVSDVVVDGVSMKVTHRNEFASIIQRNGGHPEALLPALRQQLAQAQVR
jgi:phospholipid transport system substrate-binding protein